MTPRPARRSQGGAIAAAERSDRGLPIPGVVTPRGRLLGNGRFRALLTSSGTGGAWFDGQALTSWRGDRIEDGDGWFVYLRDLEDGTFWSVGDRPVPGSPESYGTEDGPGWTAITRRDRGIACRMEAWVDADAAAECRQIVLRNVTERPRAIELTSYLEIVLNHSRAHADHPGFSKLFVQTEFVRDGELLIARRRPRGAEDRHPWTAHALRGPGPLSHESDRARFLGRGRGPEAPRALLAREPLPGTTGDVLDPALVLRRSVRIPAGEEIRLELLLVAGWSRDEVLAVAGGFAASGAIEASRARTVTAADRRRAEHGLSADQGEALERLAAALLYRDPALRPVRDVGSQAVRRAGSFPPIPTGEALTLVETGAPPAVVAAARVTHAYWHSLGLPTALVLVGEPSGGTATAEESSSGSGVLVLAARDLDAASLASLREASDLVLFDRAPWSLPGSRGAVVDAEIPSRSPDPGEPAPRAPGSPAEGPGALRSPGIPARRHAASSESRGGPPGEPTSWPLGDEPLRVFNGYGGFSARGDEYVIRMPQDPDGAPRLTPQPWVNVLANPGFGALVSETGAGCTWSRNSREFRLTPWSNDPVRDPHDEALYLRDEESGLLWSPFAGPLPGDGPYEMRHGFGASRCRHVSSAIEVETDVFVHASEPVKVVQVRIVNRGPRPRRLSVTAYRRLVLGHSLERSPRAVTTWADDRHGILFARSSDPAGFPDAVAFAAAVLPAGAGPARLGADRGQFLGAGGSPARPAALLSGDGLDGRTGGAPEPCFCHQVFLDLAVGAERTCAFLLGELPDTDAIGALVRSLRRPGAIGVARDRVTAEWAERLGAIRLESTAESLDLLANGWLAYQAIACRLWGRTAFYQSGGAFGYRDQLQDAAALMVIDPRITREQILLHCAHQFPEGDVLHWWHPPRGHGIRTRFADDLLWLPLVTAGYVRATGDLAILSESAPFVTARGLSPGEDEAFVRPEFNGGEADVYEHCCRALERSLGTGAHGLPLFGSGDWNDSMNRVGREGRGESVWMAFFLHAVLTEFLPLCEARADTARGTRLRAHQDRLRAALEEQAWDGEWYRRGFYDDGSPLGTRDGEECRIDALVQAWSVLSGAAPLSRAEQAMDAVERELISWDGGLIRLLAPPFDRTSRDPGYIKGYLPGVRENGGQYTHAALWVVAAMARLGRRDAAARLLERMSPVSRARTRGEAEVYQAEPYVVAADVYTNPQHFGRGGWTWYTGSAGWMLRVLLESVLGVRLEGGNTLVVAATLPPTWPGFRLRLRPWGRAGTYEIQARKGAARNGRVVGIALDGVALEPHDGVARVPLVDDGRDHRVAVEIE